VQGDDAPCRTFRSCTQTRARSPGRRDCLRPQAHGGPQQGPPPPKAERSGKPPRLALALQGHPHWQVLRRGDHRGRGGCGGNGQDEACCSCGRRSCCNGRSGHSTLPVRCSEGRGCRHHSSQRFSIDRQGLKPAAGSARRAQRQRRAILRLHYPLSEVEALAVEVLPKGILVALSITHPSCRRLPYPYVVRTLVECLEQAHDMRQDARCGSDAAGEHLLPAAFKDLRGV